MGLKVGDEVGARRWPMTSAHPDCWGPPWKGMILPFNDVRPWIGTLAFPRGTPSQEEVDAHLTWCVLMGYMHGQIPVLWDFGDRQVASFHEAHTLRPYSRDYQEWYGAYLEAGGKPFRKSRARSDEVLVSSV